MGPRLRKVALVAHVTTSVGWIGAVAAFLALAVAGLNEHDEIRVRSAYLATNLIAWSVIVPLSVASLVTGVVQSLGTPWGLLRHYWVLAKLALTAVATAVLLLHTGPIGSVARAAADKTLSSGDLHDVRAQFVVEASGALLVLLVATVLSVFKPKGMTRYGWRMEREQGAVARL